MSGTITLGDLRCENLRNPLGLDCRQPRFSWKLFTNTPAIEQVAYQLQVFLDDVSTTHPVLIVDSGRIESAQSVLVTCPDLALQSRGRYLWQVRVWVNQNASPVLTASEWSSLQSFEMALLTQADWQAHWIEPEQHVARDEMAQSIADIFGCNVATSEDDYKNLMPPLFLRKELQIQRKVIRRARAYATAHGIYSLRINGQPARDSQFDPGVTVYPKYQEYQTFDITRLLQSGSNTLGLIIADGWFAGRIGAPGTNHNYGDRLAALMQVEIVYDDGERQTVVTDASFKSSTGPYQYADIFIGEKYDARRAITGWDCAGFDDTGWSAVHIRPELSLAPLVAECAEPIRQIDALRPVWIRQDEGAYLVDFGQVLAGKIGLWCQGPAGTEIVIEHSEVLDEQQHFLNNILGKHKDQRDVFVLGGTGREYYEPLFTFHGFRYVRISGYPGILDESAIRAKVIASDLSETGHFECGYPALNRLHENIRWSQRSNMIAIPMDCPQRERAGWTGDLQVYADTATLFMQVDPFLNRWLRNMRLEQTADGQIPVIIPFWKSYQVITDAIFGPNRHASAGWSDACVIVPWTLYQNYGDPQILRDNYDMMIGWLRYVEQQANEEFPFPVDNTTDPAVIARHRYLWNTGFHYGDWFMPSFLNRENELEGITECAIQTKELVASSFYAYTTALVAQIAGILGKQDDAAYYRELNQHIRTAFAEEYIRPDGFTRANFQGSYVLALKFGLVPAAYVDTYVDQLCQLIAHNDGCLDTGFLSTPFLLDVLCQHQREEVAYQLLLQNRCPSWLYEVNMGASTIWEGWSAIKPDGRVTSVSYNHYASGCVGSFLYRYMMGIQPLAPGYKHIRIQPHPYPELKQAKCSYDSGYGAIISAWSYQSHSLRIEVTIPANTTGELILPNSQQYQYTEQENISVMENGDVCIQLLSGYHCYEYPFHC
jgi:alpha-L-rhamnosidase